jgi:hypothetical protein
MVFPPSILLARVGRRRLPLPVPLFLLWPIALTLWILGLPVRLLAKISRAQWLRYASWALRSLGLLWYARGLRVKAIGRSDRVELWFL